jgi:hypothetical protein
MQIHLGLLLVRGALNQRPSDCTADRHVIGSFLRGIINNGKRTKIEESSPVDDRGEGQSLAGGLT